MSTASRVTQRGDRGSRSYGQPGFIELSLNRMGSPLRRVSVADWITLGLLAVMLVSVGWSVQLANWGDLPSILPTLSLGMLAAFIASRSSAPLALKVALATVIGFAVLMWQGSIPADGSNIPERTRDAWDRFWAWIVVAREGGISTDTVPFALMFMTASWVTAYTVTALTFRLRHPWVPTVLLSVGLMSNLSFRPGLHEQTFFIFILAAIALFAHLTALRRTDKWNATNTRYPDSLHWMSMRDGLLLGAAVVVLAAVLPVFEPRSSSLEKAWEVFKAPIDALQGPANRLLSGVKGNKRERGLNVPSEVLAFQGAIDLTPDPLLWVTSPYATMLPGRVYQQYTSSGWLTAPHSTQEALARSELAALPQEFERERIQQVLQPLVDTNLVLPVSAVYSVDRDTQVEYLDPVRHVVPLAGSVAPLAELPQDLRDLAFQLRFQLRESVPLDANASGFTLNSQPLVAKSQVEQILEDLLPEDVTATVLTQGAGGLADRVVLERVGPREQTGVALAEEMRAEGLYTVTTFVSLADDVQLDGSGSDYPGWVRDRYLQLPSSLPSPVTQLANDIVRAAGAFTPYEKVRAIQAFLQQQEYSQEISGPAANVDGVYYMLFQSQDEPCPSVNPECDAERIKAYSQYFGSAATVMLRAVGVPARMVVGWAVGEYVPRAGKFLVRDQDRHGWTQIYFESYGWVDVEVTPGRDEPTRGERFSVEPVGIGGEFAFVGPIGAGEEDLLLQQDIADVERLAQLAREQAAREREAAGAGSGPAIPITPIVSAASVLGVLALLYAGWRLVHRDMQPATMAYTKMVSAGRLLGVRRNRWQTPAEFANVVAGVAPGAAESAFTIASEFERERYSQGRSSVTPGLGKHWRKVLWGLIGYRVRVIGSAGPELRERRGQA